MARARSVNFGLVAICGVVAAALLFVVQIVLIQLNLNRNNRSARELVTRLEKQFPGIRFNGGGSYERPVVYIHVHGISDPSRQMKMRDWLADVKSEQGISQEVHLIFHTDGDSKIDPPMLKL